MNKSKTERVCIELFPSTECCPKCRECCVTEAILCDSCLHWWHYKCASLSPEQVKALSDCADSTFKCPACKNFDPPPKRGKEPWRKVKTLGSLLDDNEDALHRMGLAAAAFKQHTKLWMRRAHVTEKTRVRIYNAFVLPVLTYNLGALALCKAMENRMDAFHRRQLRHVLGVFWPEIISNEALYRRTQTCPISLLAKRRRWALFGHILRLPRDVPAFLAMRAFFCAEGSFKKRRGRTRTCIAGVIVRDLLDSFDKHHRLLQNMTDLETFRTLAVNRTAWERFSNVVTD